MFRPEPSPGTAELQAVVQQIAERIGRLLEKRGLIERDCENAWLSGEPAQAGPLDDLIGHSITYRIAVGPRAGQKVFTLRRTHDAVEYSTLDWVDWFNHRRLLESIGNVPPAEYEQAHYRLNESQAMAA